MFKIDKFFFNSVTRLKESVTYLKVLFIRLTKGQDVPKTCYPFEITGDRCIGLITLKKSRLPI